MGYKGWLLQIQLEVASVYIMIVIEWFESFVFEWINTHPVLVHPLKSSHNPLQVCTFSTSTEQTKETAGIYPTHNTHIDPTPALNH